MKTVEPRPAEEGAHRDTMRILRYYPRAWVGDGGITNSIRRISEATVRAGHDVQVAIDDATDLRQDEAFTWVPVAHVGRGRLRRPVGMDAVLEGVDLMVLHSAWTHQNVRAGAAARRMGVPYVLEPRGAYDPSIFRRRRLLKRAMWETVERTLVQGAMAIHVFFESEVDQLRQIGFAGPIIVAPNGITIPPDTRWDGGSGGYLLWIGRFDPEHKGLDLLLHAVHAMEAHERPNVRLHGPDWVGGKARVEALVDELALGDTVTIGPPVYGATKWQLISAARAFAYPSRWEGFGNSAAEAVCAGVPTLVTPYPFGRWLHGRGAAIMADATAVGLADGLRRVLSSEGVAAAEVGGRLLHDELTWDAVARSWLRQAQEIAAGRLAA